MNWIDLAQYRYRWRALVKAVMELQLHKNLGNSYIGEAC
jgi:hypothetical protein